MYYIMHIAIHTCTVHAPHVQDNISSSNYVANYVFNHYQTYIVALYIASYYGVECYHDADTKDDSSLSNQRQL